MTLQGHALENPEDKPDECHDDERRGEHFPEGENGALGAGHNQPLDPMVVSAGVVGKL